jgi:hypothetical protein
MSDDPQNASKGWWQTVPGILTGVAAFLTALTGLLLALHQMGLLQQSHPTASSQSVAADGSASPTNPTDSTPAGRQSHTVPLPEQAEVHSGSAVYGLLSAQLEPYSPGKNALHLKIRMTNNGRYDANFWAASFRLLVDNSLEAPQSDLDDLVPGNSSKEAEIIFVVPASSSTVGLQMGEVGEGKPTIPLNLTGR